MPSDPELLFSPSSDMPDQPTCPYCVQPAVLTTGKVIYPKRSDLHNKSFWHCAPCDAWVGCHPPKTPMTNGQGDGTVPLGTLANDELRRARRDAHNAFDRIWRYEEVHRNSAYAWLAGRLNIRINACHIALLDVAQCKRVVEVVEEYTRGSDS